MNAAEENNEDMSGAIDEGIDESFDDMFKAKKVSKKDLTQKGTLLLL